MVEKDSYRSVRLPRAIIEKVDQYLKEHPEYHSRLEIINEAIRMHIKEYEKK